MAHTGEGDGRAGGPSRGLVGCLLLLGAAAIGVGIYILIWQPRIWLRPDIEWVNVSVGEILVGSDPALDPYARSNETPRHLVRVEAFRISRYEITNDQYARCVQAGVCGEPGDLALHQDPSLTDHPVVNVDWQNGHDFCAWIGGRLPTESEWEYAARGGSSTQGYLYAGSDNPDDVAWYWENSGRHTFPVGQLAPNELGLYDMSGNVAEWVADQYEPYSSHPQENPSGPEEGSHRVVRNGSWDDGFIHLRSARRFGLQPDARYSGTGFRCAR